MSLFETETLACPNCGTQAEFDNFHSINADRRPDLAEAVVFGRLQRITCANCGTDFRSEPSINYLAVDKGLWMMVRPLPTLAHWAEEETDATAAFDLAYGSGAPDAARQIGNDLTVRLCFGWAAFREKIVLRDAELSDVTAECMKMAILANRPGNPAAPGVELRVLGAQGPTLNLGWIDAASNRAVDLFEAPRALYDDIHDNDAWSAQSKALTEGPFTDIQRLTIPPTPRTEGAA